MSNLWNLKKYFFKVINCYLYLNVELIVIYNDVIEEHNVYIKALRNIKNNEQLVVYFDGFFDYQSNNYSINIVSENFIVAKYLKK